MKKVYVEYNDIVRDFHTTPLVAKVLAYHQLSSEKIKQVLFDEPIQLSKAPCMEKAKLRLLQAMARKEKVFVGGDYDADGLCATTIMVDGLKRMGLDVGYYVPNRFKEGYGLSSATVKLAHEKGYRLIVTVDNGVTAFDAIETAKNCGIDIMITDHHRFDEEVTSDYFIHPSLLEEPFQALSGAGLAYQLIASLGFATDYHLVLACIATIGDVVELWDCNRSIVKEGLKVLRQRKFLSIELLWDKVEQVISETEVAYQIVPKLNAVGRLGDKYNVNMVVKYLLCQDEVQLRKMAYDITAINRLRKEMSIKQSDLIRQQTSEDDFIILKDSRFHEGILGLVAGKLANDIKKPVLLFSQHETVCKGSGRSIPGFDMRQFLSDNFSDYLSFGGHSQALGLSISSDNFDEFKHIIKQQFSQLSLEPIVEEALVIEQSDVTVDSISSYYKLAPFGQGFSHPLMAIKEMETISSMKMKQLYPKYVWQVQQEKIEGISFDKDFMMIPSPTWVFGTLSVSQYQGNKKSVIQLKSVE